jgi:hypothetical protein
MPEDEVDVVVSVSDNRLDQLDQVVEELRAAGLRVRSTQERLGTVTGSVPAAGLDALSNVAGVDFVEQDRELRLPPPDSEIQ